MVQTEANRSVRDDRTSAELSHSVNSFSPATRSKWEYVHKTIAAEISEFSRYYDSVVQVEPISGDNGSLLKQIESEHKSVVLSITELLDMYDLNSRKLVLLNGNCNFHTDIEDFLRRLKPSLSRESRLVIVAYNPYFLFLYQLANKLGFRHGAIPETFLTETGLGNLARLAGFEIVRVRNAAYIPWHLFGLGQLVNAIMPVFPLLRYLSFAEVITLRPVKKSNSIPSLTVVIPARNERGNIEDALRRLPKMPGTDIEVIFVEGHSSDGTWEEIQRVIPLYENHWKISAFKQTGKGKADAVRLGFSKATKDLLTILDADLSMPPELLVRYYNAYCAGLADFVNGSRLLYPIEGKAMKFLNKLGNVFFAKALSAVLAARLSDTLCGTKLFSRDSYERFTRWRKDFGDFDPFGDFELLFPACVLGLSVIDVPIRYRDRQYGDTNISRFRHGFMLFKMTFIGLLRITLGRTAR